MVPLTVHYNIHHGPVIMLFDKSGLFHTRRFCVLIALRCKSKPTEGGYVAMRRGNSVSPREYPIRNKCREYRECIIKLASQWSQAPQGHHGNGDGQGVCRAQQGATDEPEGQHY